MGLPAVGDTLTDLRLPDHAGHDRLLSELVAGDPCVVQFYRGWWCPKEQTFFRRLVALQDELEVAYARIVSISVDAPEVQAAFRAGIGARWTFLSDHGRTAIGPLGLRETIDTLNDPYLPVVLVVAPDLSIRNVFDGYWALGRPTNDELRLALREVARELRDDWDAPTP